MTTPTCPRSESAYDFITGRMTGAERSAFEDHLAKCPHCREEVEALRVTVGHLDAWPGAEVSPGFARQILARIEAPRPRLVDRLREWLRPRPLPIAVGAVVAAGLVVAVIGIFPQILSDPALRHDRKVVVPAEPAPPPPTIAPRDVVPRPGTRPPDDKVKPSPDASEKRTARVTTAPRRPLIGGRPTSRSGEGAPSPPAKQPALKTVMPYMVRKTPPPRPTVSSLGRRKTTRRVHRAPDRPGPGLVGRLEKKTAPPPKPAAKKVKPRTSTPRGRPERALPARQKPAPEPPAARTRVARRLQPPAAQVRQAPGGQPRRGAFMRTPADRRALPQNMAMVLSLVDRYQGRVIKPEQRTAEGVVLKVVIPLPHRQVFLIRLNGLKRHGVRRLDKSLVPINILVKSPPTR